MRLLYTAKMEIRYRKPVPIGVPITLRGRIEKDRGMIAYAIGEVILSDGSIAAASTATLMEVPKPELAKMNTEEVGWKVYPIP